MDVVRVWAVYCVAPYAVLSALVYSVRLVQPFQDAVANLTPVLWLAGPPALLLFDLRDSIYPFAIGSVLVLAGMLAIVYTVRRREPGSGLGVGVIAFVWVCFGLLAYAATF